MVIYSRRTSESGGGFSGDIGDIDLSDYALTDDVNTALLGKVDKVVGKGLSEEDFTAAEKSQLAGLETALGNKQNVLVSGTTIKTINSESLLGSGDLTITPGIANPIPIVYQSIQAITYNQGGNSTMDNGAYNTFTLTANGTGTTIAHSNVPPAGNRYGFELHLTWTSGTITWPASWTKGDSKPTTTGSYIISGITIDGGVSFKIAILAE